MMKKYANILGWTGLGFALLGLVIYSINLVLSTLPIIFLAVGAVLLIVFVVLRFKDIKAGLSSRSARFGTNAMFMIIFLLGILIVINIIFSRFSYRADLTASKIFSLAEQTRKVLKHLDKDVKVTGFFKTGEEQQALELLKEYAQYSSRFQYEFVDPDKKPGLAKKYNIKTYGTIVLESQGKEEKINKSTEEDITNALITVTREGVKKLYFVTGHGERDYDNAEQTGYSFIKQAITEENFQIDKILLANPPDSLPDDCSVLVFAAPKTDLFDFEQIKVNNYLKKGGKVLLLLDTDSPESYVALAREWGINVGHDIVVDASGIGQLFGAGPTIPIVSQYEEHAISKDFAVMTFFPETRSVFASESAPTGITVNEIAKTSPQSWAETSPLTTGRITMDEDQDIKGPVPILTVAEKDAETPASTEDKFDLGPVQLKSRLAVFGDADFASNGYIKVQGNTDLFMNVISWMAGEEDLISVRPRDPEDRRINISQKQSRLILYLGVLLLPIVIFATGIVVYIKRK
ncbi:MAG TPA: Gldg family protein [bacterium]|nr:Gldg family protein [bacterium]HPN45334.1 Gldg family protein [bacterium]